MAVVPGKMNFLSDLLRFYNTIQAFMEWKYGKEQKYEKTSFC